MIRWMRATPSQKMSTHLRRVARVKLFSFRLLSICSVVSVKPGATFTPTKDYSLK